MHVVDDLQERGDSGLCSASPNSPACLIALIVSSPALASTITLALEDCAWSRNDEKSAVPSGC